MFQDQIPIIISQAMVLAGGFVGKISMILPFQLCTLIYRRGFIWFQSNHKHSPSTIAIESHLAVHFFPKNLIPGFYCVMRFGGFGSLENYQTSWKSWKSQVLSQNVHHFEIQKSVSPHQRGSPQKSSNLRQRWKFLVFAAQRIHPRYKAHIQNESVNNPRHPNTCWEASWTPQIYHPNTKPQEVWLDV